MANNQKGLIFRPTHQIIVDHQNRCYVCTMFWAANDNMAGKVARSFVRNIIAAIKAGKGKWQPPKSAFRLTRRGK